MRFFIADHTQIAFEQVAMAAERLSHTNPHAAVALYDRAIALRPDHSGPMNNKAILLAQLGQVEQATEVLRNAIAISPDEPMLYYNYGTFDRFVEGDELTSSLRRLERNIPILNVHNRILLKFALSKMADDLGDHDNALHHLLEANALKRSFVSYDRSAMMDLLDRTRAVFDPDLISSTTGARDAGPSPCFILSMPRSGSTLVEQILSGHPQVFGLGEINAFSQSVDVFAKHATTSYPELASLSTPDLSLVARLYLDRLPAIPPGVSTVIDKSLDNIWYAGLIHLALPRARFIHVVRNPVDTCLSCFSKLFTTDIPYTYDLAELGHAYRCYESLMDHWKGYIAADRMIDLRYEDLVADPNGQARRLLSFCDLSWDANCLDVQYNRRPVRTASAVQVRRPIYTTSVDRWRFTNDAIRPLLDALQA